MRKANLTTARITLTRNVTESCVIEVTFDPKKTNLVDAAIEKCHATPDPGWEIDEGNIWEVYAGDEEDFEILNPATGEWEENL